MSVHDISRIDSSTPLRSAQNDRDEGAVVDVPMREQRDIQTVTAEIRTLQAQTQRLVLEYAIEVGRRLCEAKEMLPHGEWGKWLKEEVSFSRSTANDLMRVFRECSAAQITIDGAVAKSQALGNLSYTKALRLLALPEEEREEFVETHDVEGMSTRELERAIREKQDAEKKLESVTKAMALQEAYLQQSRDKAELAKKEKEQAEKELLEQTSRLEAERKNLERIKNEQIELREKLDKAKAAEKKAKDALAELKKNPQVAPEVLERLKQEAEEAAKKAAEAELARQSADAEAARQKLEAQAADAERAAEQARQELEAARKQLAMSSPEIAVFKTRFEAVQQAVNAMLSSWERVRTEDKAAGEKCARAILSVAESMQRVVQEEGEDNADPAD